MTTAMVVARAKTPPLLAGALVFGPICLSKDSSKCPPSMRTHEWATAAHHASVLLRWT